MTLGPLCELQVRDAGVTDSSDTHRGITFPLTGTSAQNGFLFSEKDLLILLLCTRVHTCLCVCLWASQACGCIQGPEDIASIET